MLATPTRTHSAHTDDNPTVVKRDGRHEPFHKEKIHSAVDRCLKLGLGATALIAQAVADDISHRVTNILRHRGGEVGVEDIQRLVIQQLWAVEQFDAAEHYTIYREQRRQERVQSPINPEEVAAILEDDRHFPMQTQRYQFISKFARWNADKQRRETWRESCNRVMNFFRSQPQLKLQEEEWADLDEHFFRLKASPAMRVLQMAGPAMERCHVAGYNCAYLPICDLFAFAEMLYILMQGTGCGFSVESIYVDMLPRIRKQKKNAAQHLVIEDSTDGWCDALRVGMESWFAGEDVTFGCERIRPAGTRLRVKGGRASGPEPLKQLLNFVRQVILARQGGHLSPLDCHDICCMIGKIVQVGGVRRASEISLSDLDDEEMRNAKTGTWGEKAPWRDMANNSAVYEGSVPAVAFMEEWLSLAKSGSGERGIFNREAVIKACPPRRKHVRFGCNPCAEIVLRPFGFCNLTIAIPRPGETVASLEQKVRIATLFGVMQSTLTDFKYIRPEWKKNAEEERLLGVDITGHMECPLLQPSNPERERLVQYLRKVVDTTARKYSERFGINRSAADTTIKPAGDSSQFFYCGSGLHAWFAHFFLRRFRASVNDPVSKLLIAEGVPCHQDPFNAGLLVFEFPMKAPPGAVVRNDMTAMDMLKNWLFWKKNWAEHSVSCTVYVDQHEWLDVGHWVYQNFDDISGISFLPKDNGTYSLTPYEEITEEEYNRRMQSFPAIDWSKLRRYEIEDMTTTSQEYACTGGSCERI